MARKAKHPAAARISRVLGAPPIRPGRRELWDAHRILVAAYESAESFNAVFERLRKARKAAGTTTDEEQDLLRAMLLFACSGLDSLIKQLVRDVLPRVLERDAGARRMLQEHIQRRLTLREAGAGERLERGIDAKFLASVLASGSSHAASTLDLVVAITGDSMQSKEQVMKAAAHFGIASKDLIADPTDLQRVFSARNQISHEMDVDLTAVNRKRRSRTKAALIKDTKVLLEIGAAFLHEVDKKLAQPSLLN